MDSNFQKVNPNPNPNSRSRETIDHRLDQWFETSRQFVDGVAGTRPGKRHSVISARRGRSNLETVGRWVSDKIDWFLDDDEWQDSLENESKLTYSGKKRPLQAISRRGLQKVPSNQLSNEEEFIASNEWPDDSTFRLERWQRRQTQPKRNQERSINIRSQSLNNTQRPLPRSSRRRN